MNRTHAFRQMLVARFLRLAGVVTLVSPLLAGCAGSDTSCFTWAQDSCPARENALGYMLLCDSEECITSVDSEGIKEEGACCYDVTKEESDDGCGFLTGCAVEGRPFLVESCVVTAAPRPARRAADWSAAGVSPRVEALTPSQRRAIADSYTQSALFEHASVASFSRFSLELLAVGAPADLVADAHRAALDEVEHTKLCFALASVYGGAAVEPSSFPLGRTMTIATDLAQVAASAVREGCIGETLAAIQAGEELAGASDPAVRVALAQIAEDEARHAELAWRTVIWALEIGGDEVHAAVAAAFAEAKPAAPIAPSAPDADAAMLAAHGRLDEASVRAVHRLALVEVVLPCAREILARRVVPARSQAEITARI